MTESHGPLDPPQNKLNKVRYQLSEDMGDDQMPLGFNNNKNRKLCKAEEKLQSLSRRDQSGLESSPFTAKGHPAANKKSHT